MKLAFCASLSAMSLAVAAPCGSEGLSSQPGERAHLFTTCAGRFDALATHYRATDNPDLDLTDNMLAQFEDLAETMIPDAEAVGITKTDLAVWRQAGRNDISELILELRLGLATRSEEEANLDFVDKLQLCAQLLLPPDETD